MKSSLRHYKNIQPNESWAITGHSHKLNSIMIISGFPTRGAARQAAKYYTKRSTSRWVVGCSGYQFRQHN
jgi:hypothetical protein